MIKDDFKRNFLVKTLGLAATLAAAPILANRALAEGDFDDYRSGMGAGLFKVEDAFSQYKEKYTLAYREYQAEIANSWLEVELSSSTAWVYYNQTMEVKRVVDFAHNEIRISIQGNALKGFTPADFEPEFLAALMMDIGTAYRADPVLSKVVGGEPPNSPLKVLALDKALVRSLAKSAVLSRKPGKVGDCLMVVAKLPVNSLAERAESFLPYVEKSSAKWQVSKALIMAIMHAESAFNPLARSHDPAFGLMQISPKSSGRNVSRLVFGQERMLNGADLYEPQLNIDLGAAYLHLLDQQYLKGITDFRSRQLCVIAAYNAGANSVAYAFTGTSSIKKALPLINRLSSQQVYGHLRSQLKLEDTRNYVKRVADHLERYS